MTSPIGDVEANHLNLIAKPPTASHKISYHQSEDSKNLVLKKITHIKVTGHEISK